VNGVLPAALAEVVVITYRDVKNGSSTDNPIPHLPLPSQYTAVMIVYGALSLFSGDASKFAALFGWGLVAATLLNLWTPNGGVNGAAGSTLTNVTTPSGTGPVGPAGPAG